MTLIIALCKSNNTYLCHDRKSTVHSLSKYNQQNAWYPKTFSQWGSPSSNAVFFSILHRANDSKFREEKQTVLFLADLLLTSSIYNTCLLAFFFCLEAVVIAATATVPELCTRVGLLIIVPVDFVLAAGALFQCEETTGINRLSLCGEKGELFGEYLLHAC